MTTRTIPQNNETREQAAGDPHRIAGVIPASTRDATLRRLARRYSDSSDPIVRALPPDYARQIRRRLIFLLCGVVVDEVAA